MNYKQVLSEEECKGKIIDRILEYCGETYFIFSDNTFCVYNVHIARSERRFSKNLDHDLMVYLGFMTKEEQQKIITAKKLKDEKNQELREIRWLKELAEKYPNKLVDEYKAKYEKCINVINRFDPGIIGMYDL